MAKEHRMIEPFSEDQVREGVISYGVSSYGYDVRIADEFKIFTNINSTIVDPKHFDPRSFVDFKGDVCIIPPNSFALARTVEYFRIPRSVITICVGKCLGGDTRVLDADTGRLVRIADRVGRSGATPSLKRGAVTATDATDGVAQGVLPTYEVVTRTGRKLRATPNHPFLTFGGWRSLQDLAPGARVGVPSRIPVFGRGHMAPHEVDLLGLFLSDGTCRTPGASPCYTSGDPELRELFGRAVSAFGGVPRPASRFTLRATNRGRRGGVMEKNRIYAWLESLGLSVRSPEKFVPSCVFELPRPLLARFLRALFSGDGGISISGEGIHLEYCSTSERLARDTHHLLLRFGIPAMLRSRSTASGRTAFVLSVTSKDNIGRFAEHIGFVPGTRKQKKLEEALARIDWSPQQKWNFDTLPAAAWDELQAACARRGCSMRSMGIEATQPQQSLSRSLARDLAERLGDEILGEIADSDILWDTIKEKRFVGFEPVFDLTVPETQNFIGNDVVVHNSTYARCGIIVNVTPFEPEWEGIVTLEVSNTTPLPAKIYANEGIAQILFFESDEVCETSYADKKGKYQAQKGLTLPRL
jgi:deoxycytidine triphosphate deaminase/intein/homing endonuclease